MQVVRKLDDANTKQNGQDSLHDILQKDGFSLSLLFFFAGQGAQILRQLVEACVDINCVDRPED